MPRIRTSLALAGLAVPLLAGCGSSSSGPSNIRDIDPAEARTLFPGSTPPETTGAEGIRSAAGQTLRTIGQSPDIALHMSDAVLFSTREISGLPERVSTRCDDSECSASIDGAGSISFTAATLPVGGDDIRAMMVHRRIPLAHGTSRTTGGLGDLDVYNYGGWMRYNIFAAVEVAVTSGAVEGLGLYYGLSVGAASNAPPSPTGGSATWSGVMVGMDNAGADRGNVIQGDAGITVDFDALQADVAFTNVHDLTAGTPRDGNTWNDAPITSQGTFSSANGPEDTVRGRFYGPGHEEAGGVFEYDGITGAFGASRDD